jgi:Flp pilus assembly protein TadG
VARSTVIGRFSRAGRDRDQRGAVIVEFALVVPILLLLVFGIFEFGYMLNRDMIIGNASRDGARVASLNGSAADIRAAITTELNASGIYTQPSDIKIDCVLPDGTACNASTDAIYTAKAESGSTAVIKVSYTYKWITPLASSLFGNDTVLSQTTQMRVE